MMDMIHQLASYFGRLFLPTTHASLPALVSAYQVNTSFVVMYICGDYSIKLFLGKPDPKSSSFMRELVASTVISQLEQYNEALLGKPNKEYRKWILQV